MKKEFLIDFGNEYYDGQVVPAIIIKRKEGGYTLAKIRRADLASKLTDYPSEEEKNSILEYIENTKKERESKIFFDSKTPVDAEKEGVDWGRFLELTDIMTSELAWQNAVKKEVRNLTDEELEESEAVQ